MRRAAAIMAWLSVGAALWSQAPALPVIREFQAVPQFLVPGAQGLLVWAVDGADSVTISGIGAVPPSGAATISPATTTTYTLIAKSAAGQVFATTTVLVTAASPPGIGISPQQLNFFDVVVGQPADLNLDVQLAFYSDLQLSIMGDSSFAIVGPTSASAPSMRVTVRFTPDRTGMLSGNLRIDLPTIAQSISVPLNGSGVASENSVAITGFSNIANPANAIGSDTWLSIYGRNLGVTTRSWTTADFVDGHCPTALDGVSVLIDGQPGYVSYVSPTQINVLAPGSFGITAVVQTPQGVSSAIPLGGAPFVPQFLGVPPEYLYAYATLPDGTYVGPAGMLGPGTLSRPAVPGDSIAVYLTGAGPAMRPYQDGVFAGPTPVGRDIYFVLTPANSNQSLVVQGDYLVEIGPGVYQAGVRIPPMAAGDAAISFVLGNAPSAGEYSLAIGSQVDNQ